MEPLVWLEWVERLGGWAVVVFVIRYFMQSRVIENREHSENMTALIIEFRRSVDSFKEFEDENRTTHEVIVDGLRAQAETLKLIEVNTRRANNR